MSKSVISWLALLALFAPHIKGGGLSRGRLEALKDDSIYESFKFNLIRYYGVSESFAEQFKINLKRAVNKELQLEFEKHPRQNTMDEYDEDEEVTGPTTEGPSPFNIVTGLYGLFNGISSLNPDRVLASTANFFPPSQRPTAEALINSALGKNPGTWPTTTPTTTKPTTKDPEEDLYDEDEETTKKPTTVAVVTVAGAVTLAPVPTTTPPALPPLPPVVAVAVKV